ncbi:hypothetical protein F5B19DRAFT_88463 [Rostrohypoxylon terebratum]|nr:hypothetical protein F5B19DRAFT_88463 [Rostrohypoxylon terebratum]
MASTRSDEAVQGSVGPTSNPRPAPDPSYASARLNQYSEDIVMPVNDHLSSAPPSQLGLSHVGPCSAPIRLINNVLPGQQPPSVPAGQASAPTSTHSTVDGYDYVQGVGSSFDGFDAASPPPQIIDIDEEKAVHNLKKQ